MQDKLNEYKSAMKETCQSTGRDLAAAHQVRWERESLAQRVKSV